MQNQMSLAAVVRLMGQLQCCEDWLGAVMCSLWKASSATALSCSVGFSADRLMLEHLNRFVIKLQ